MSDSNKNTVPPSVKAVVLASALVGGTIAALNYREKIKEASTKVFQTASKGFDDVSDQCKQHFDRMTRDKKSEEDLINLDNPTSTTSENSCKGGFSSKRRANRRMRNHGQRLSAVISDDDSLSTPSTSDSETIPYSRNLPLEALALD